MINTTTLIQRTFLLILLICCWILLIIQYAKALPDLFLPHSIEDIKQIQSILTEYSQTQSTDMFLLFSFIFIFKQTFGIPGALILNIVAGSLYGIWGLPLVCTCASIGSLIMYQISKHLLGHLVFGKCIPKQSITRMKVRIDENRHHLLLFMISIRSVPIIPGWFINLTSPFVGVDVRTFAISTWLGSIPYVFICIQAASTLSNIHQASDIFSFWVIVKLIFIFLIIIIPVIFKNRIMKWVDGGYDRVSLESIV